MDYKEYYKKQISLTEWFHGIDHDKTEALRLEDNEKRERLNVLNEIIKLPYDAPYQFSADDIATNTKVFQEFLNLHGLELCALRLIPLQADLPKHRMRGHTITKAVEWFHELGIDPTRYRADFVPHSDRPLWSTIFVVNETGIHGEVITGGLNQLTDGLYQDGQPILFHFDFHSLHLSSHFPYVENLRETIERLRVKDSEVQDVISEKLDGRFVQGYLSGYFEACETEDFGLWFIDYNRILGGMYADFIAVSNDQSTKEKAILSGQVASKGKARGKVRIVNEEGLETAEFTNDEILVCRMTTPAYVSLIRKAVAVVTDLGGILSHAAIICRELGKPCVVGTHSATLTLKDGDVVEVDADKGCVRICD